ncbi:hypothetical protein CTAYLR_001788 [Chrysophaeum taylorii]|uniref:CN hydrolase domain-containing protein n=1 Tax=Chrysophaeum taylorii TaxID=2483200 RepID=A0AAD7UF21_9STRA|nr:hypothetical protein CTAYLR_001788 [Chrysophaeum taylorii]
MADGVRCEFGKVGENLERAGRLIREIAKRDKHDLFCLPELSASGYPGGDGAFDSPTLDAVIEKEDGRSKWFFASVARDVGAFVAYGVVLESEDGRPTLSHAVVSPSGDIVARYDKVHLAGRASIAGEAPTFKAGKSACSFDVRGLRVGVAVCYDLRFPRLWRKLDCDVVLHPCCFERDDTFPSWSPLVQTRAIENQCYVLSISHAGESYGGSMAMPPWLGGFDGETFEPTVLGTEEGALPLVVEKRVLDAVRTKYPYRADEVV